MQKISHKQFKIKGSRISDLAQFYWMKNTQLFLQ